MKVIKWILAKLKNPKIKQGGDEKRLLYLKLLARTIKYYKKF